MLFKNLKEIQDFLEADFLKFLNSSLAVEMILSEAMSLAVHEVVYTAYEPLEYERREDNEGLSDPRNMEILSVTIQGGKVQLLIENLTEGADSMIGKFISDTIVDGLSENWMNSHGVWADKRDYITQAANNLRDNPKELMEAIQTGMAAAKYKFKK